MRPNQTCGVEAARNAAATTPTAGPASARPSRPSSTTPSVAATPVASRPVYGVPAAVNTAIQVGQRWKNCGTTRPAAKSSARTPKPEARSPVLRKRCGWPPLSSWLRTCWALTSPAAMRVPSSATSGSCCTMPPVRAIAKPVSGYTPASRPPRISSNGQLISTANRQPMMSSGQSERRRGGAGAAAGAGQRRATSHSPALAATTSSPSSHSRNQPSSAKTKASQPLTSALVTTRSTWRSRPATGVPRPNQARSRDQPGR